MTEPSLWARLLEFSVTVASGWFFWVGLFLMVEPYLENTAPEFWRRSDEFLKRWLPQWRRRLFRVVGLIAILAACFQAWEVQYIGKLESEYRLQAVSPSQQQATIDKLTSEIQKLRADQWPSLSAEQAKQLVTALGRLRPQSIIVACETLACKSLSDDLVKAFRDAGWEAKGLHSGGLGITGTNGISLNPNEEATQQLKSAIEQSTTLTVSIGPVSRREYGNEPAFLVIGTRPF